MSDPERLLGSNDPLARALLSSAPSSLEPTDAECDALWSSLARRLPEAVLVGTAGAALSNASAKVALSSVLLKTAVAIGVVTSVAAVVATRAWPTAQVAAPVTSAMVVTPPPVVRAMPTSTPTLTLTAEPPPPLPTVPVTASPPVRTARALPIKPPASAAPSSAAGAAPANDEAIEPAPPADAAKASSLRAESAVLLHARKSLRAGDCAAAKSELDEARGRFSGGTLTQEREVLTIEALACSGQPDAAKVRAAAFLRDYPTSPHADAVRTLTR